MKKYVQSAWMRVLSCILCTVSSIGLVISVLGFWVFAQMGGSYEIYLTVNEEIAETYALYAIDEMELENEEELTFFFAERGIACSIVHVANSQISAEKDTRIEEPLFSTGTIDEKSSYLIEMVPGTTMRYHEDSLLSVLMGYTTYDSVYTHVEFPIELMVFDSSTGLFYYKTEVGYFEVEDIRVWTEGTYTDYILTKVDGEKCYYNGYFRSKLDTSQYMMWDDVIIDGLCLKLDGTPEERTDGILVVSDITSFDIPIRDSYHESNGDTLLCEYEDYMDKYQIYISWDEPVAYKGSDNSLFYEWKNLYGIISEFESNVIISIVLNFILLIASGALLIYSAIGEKEKLGFLYKVPLCTYSGVILIIEILLLILLNEGIIDGLIYDNMGSLENVLLLAVLVVVVMVWLAFTYLQNIVTRFKTRTFIQYSEFYYAYKILKWVWEK